MKRNLLKTNLEAHLKIILILLPIEDLLFIFSYMIAPSGTSLYIGTQRKLN